MIVDDNAVVRNIDDLPPAPPDRERDARELSKHRHEWYCFSFDDYRYSDPELDRWIQRLGDILFNR